MNNKMSHNTNNYDSNLNNMLIPVVVIWASKSTINFRNC